MTYNTLSLKAMFREHFRKMKILKKLTRFIIAISKIIVIHIVKFQFSQLKNYKASKVSKGAKIRNRYIQVLHLTQDTNGKVTNSQLDTTNESQEVSPFPARTTGHI